MPTMNPPVTMYTGPLGSTVHALHADSGTVVELAAVDWSRHYGRVRLDPAGGIITLMSPSRLHEDLARILDIVVDAAGSILAGAVDGLRSTRLRRSGDPPGTGVEPDCAFYIGRHARDYRAALVEGEAAADAFLDRTAPDLVVEVEITSADEGKIERYGEMGVRELWWLRGRRGTRELRAEFLALRPGSPPRKLQASELLVGLTPGDVCEAVEGVRLSLTLTERMEAVARVVRRRRQESVRVREEEAPYASHSE